MYVLSLMYTANKISGHNLHFCRSYTNFHFGDTTKILVVRMSVLLLPARCAVFSIAPFEFVFLRDGIFPNLFLYTFCTSFS